MRHLVKLLLLLLVAVPSWAQYPAPSGGFDTYHGLNGSACTHGAATAFSLDTVTRSGNQNRVLCDFSGHTYYLRSFFTFDNTQPGGTDEFGHTYNFYTTAKYGTQQSWADNSILRFLSWGYNGLLPGRATSVTNPWTTSNPVPFVAGADIANYSVYNPQGYLAGCLPHDIATSLKLTTFGGQTTGTLSDFLDSCWGTWYFSYLSNDVAFAVRSQSTAMKHFLISISDCDADNCHGFGAGPDFVPANGNYDFRLGTMGLFAAPIQYADSGRGQVYTSNSALAIKAQLLTRVQATYANVGALNTAWGSSFTTFGTSGTCVGSHAPAFTCGSTVAADSLGTGNGSTTVFSTTLSHPTTISKLSLAVYVAGTLVGGDNGAGKVFGNKSPAITLASSTINYSTGAITITFGSAPANGAALTVEYIQNGWQLGTGLMDEDCRGGHTYCGSSVVFLTGMTTAMKADINSVTQSEAQSYASQAVSSIATWASANSFTGKVLHSGIYALGSWGAPPDSFVLAGLAAGGQDIIIASGSGNGFSHWTQGMLDYVRTNWGADVPIIESSYRVSNRDSNFAWYSQPVTGSGTTATATMTLPIYAAPYGFQTGSLIDTFCTNTAFNRLQVHPTAVNPGTGVLTWTTSGGVSGSTSCTIMFSDNNEGGFTSQVARATDYKNDVGVAPTVGYTSSGVRMYVGIAQWAWQDYKNEQLNWGVVNVKDNPYNGIDNNGTGTFACQTPDATHTCGGEAADHLNGGPQGDYLDLAGQAHGQIDSYFLAAPSPPAVTLNPTSAAFGNAAQNSPDTSCNVTNNPCTIILTNSGGSILNISSIVIVTGTHFSITNITCGATLAAGNSCNVTVTFTPHVLGALSDTLRFTTDASTSPDNVTLTGTGVIPTAPAVQMSMLRIE